MYNGNITMTLLSGILGSSSFQSNAAVTEFDQAEGEQALAGIVNTSNAIDVGSERLGALMSAAVNIMAVSPKSTDAIKMARIHLAEAMTACELSDSEAIQATAALEDDGVDVGLEAWSSVKTFVGKIIDWLKKQWAKLKAFVMKYWNKYFGDIERLKKAWVKVQAEAKTKGTGHTLTKGAKHNFESNAEYFHIGNTPLTPEDITAYAGKAKIVDEIDGLGVILSAAENVSKKIDTDLELRDNLAKLTDQNSVDTVFTQLGSGMLGQLTGMSEIGMTAQNVPASLVGSKKDVKLATPMVIAGYAGYVSHIELSTDNTPAFLKSVRVGFGVIDASYKKAKKANLALSDASAIEELADDNIDVCTALIGFIRGSDLKKATASMDKAIKDLEKIKGDVPDSKDGYNAVATYKTFIGILVEEVNIARSMIVNFPVDTMGYHRKVSAAHLDYAQRSLKAIKKD